MVSQARSALRVANGSHLQISIKTGHTVLRKEADIVAAKIVTELVGIGSGTDYT